MKSIDEVIEYYSRYQTPIVDKFGVRLYDFLDESQIKKLGFTPSIYQSYMPKEWNETNILNQLKEDLELGWEECCNRNEPSARLMYYVVKSWCIILENGYDRIPYSKCGTYMFRTINDYYNWNIT